MYNADSTIRASSSGHWVMKPVTAPTSNNAINGSKQKTPAVPANMNKHWALRHPEQFPIDVNKVDYEMLLRVPGIGVKSARLIVASRRFSTKSRNERNPYL